MTRSAHAVRVALAAILLTLLTGSPRAQDAVDLSRFIVVGDMLIDVHRVAPAPEGSDRPASFLMGAPWPGGVVPVGFVAAIPAGLRSRFFANCEQWSRVAAVRCVGRTSEPNYVSVSNAAYGCNATLGYGGGVRPMNLGPDCWSDVTLQHEIGHLLGLMHEHQRSDRDQYVTVDTTNIQPGSESHFVPIAGSQNVGPYDFQSVMHYGSLAFALVTSRPVLRPRPGFERYALTMGQGQPPQPPEVFWGNARRPSAGDRAGIRARYGASPTYVGEPIGLHVVAASGNTMTIAWTAPPGPPVRGYTVRAYKPRTGRIASLGAILEVPLPPTQTSIAGAVPAGAYLVDVTATGDAGESAPSNTLAFYAPGGAPFVPPAAPILTSAVAGGDVTLSWTGASSSPPAAYTIEAGPPGGPMQRFHVGAVTSVTAPLPVGVPLRIAVEARVPYSFMLSNVVRVQVGGLQAPVLAPPSVSGRAVSLSWSAVPGATSYAVRARATLEGPVVVELPTTATSLYVPNVPPGTYNVFVVARGGSHQSDESVTWQFQVH